jgi:hypothetical protein
MTREGRRGTAARLALLFACGAVLGSIFDGFHTFGGATAYPSPVLLRMAWWTPLLFGAAGLGIGLSHADLDRRLRRPPRPLSDRAVAGGLVYFGLFYFMSGFLPTANSARLALLALGFLVLWLLLDRSWQGLALAAMTAVIGCSVEVMLTGAGAFQHLRPDLLGIPAWLPALYMLASLAVGNLGRRLLGASA